ncbi:PqqD family protein [Paenibacillus antri]|uniref:PqqD family protein n=1 Tax=Paenibacillus antri TaxID=2582848 RepID=A0A5R9G7H9_9BACL|nr:PqqD family protein [Paenibacillus antri]TLS49388.1 PqqD family protein [Paenibacillus antri]
MAEYSRKAGCEAVRLDDEWMIVDTERATITKVNHTGGLCWTLLSGPQTAASLAEEFRLLYGTDPEVLEQELHSFLTDLHGCGLVERVY